MPTSRKVVRNNSQMRTTTDFSSIVSALVGKEASYDLSTFPKFINLIRGRLFMLSLTIHDEDSRYMHYEDEDIYSTSLNTLMTHVITCCFWQNAFNSYSLFRYYQASNGKKKGLEIVQRYRNLNNQIDNKCNSDIICDLKVDRLNESNKKILDLKVQTAAKLDEILTLKQTFIPNIDEEPTNNYDGLNKKGPALYLRNVRFLCNITLSLIENRVNPQIFSDRNINKITKKCNMSLNKYGKM